MEQFSGFPDLVPVVDRLMAETRGPRSPEDLLDLVDPLGLGSGSLVIDAGSYDGNWARRLEKRFGSEALAVDVTPAAVGAAAQNGTRAVTGDLQHLPIRAAAADLVWCRDMLSCVPDPLAALREFWRVLKPTGAVVLYVAFPTPELEPLERERLLKALDAPEWWGRGRAAVDDAIHDAGFDVVRQEPVSPEHQERALLDGGDVARELAVLGRLQRERARFESEMGVMWYERWRAWMAWAAYLLLGKLQTVVWVLRKA